MLSTMLLVWPFKIPESLSRSLCSLSGNSIFYELNYVERHIKKKRVIGTIFHLLLYLGGFFYLFLFTAKLGMDKSKSWLILALTSLLLDFIILDLLPSRELKFSL